MSDTLGSVNVDPSKLSDRDKQELQQFMQSELQKSTIQECKYPAIALVH
jgi:hypothetical protein